MDQPLEVRIILDAVLNRDMSCDGIAMLRGGGIHTLIRDALDEAGCWSVRAHSHRKKQENILFTSIGLIKEMRALRGEADVLAVPS